MRALGAVVVRIEQPSGHRRQTQGGEVGAAHELGGQVVGGAVDRDVDGHAPSRRGVGQDIAGGGGDGAELRIAEAPWAERDQPLGIVHVKAVDHHRMDEPEDREIGSETERQRDDGRGAETGVPPDRAETVPNVTGDVAKERQA